MLFTDLSWPSLSKEVCTAAIIESQYVVVSIYKIFVVFCHKKKKSGSVCLCERLQFFSKVEDSSAAVLLGISSQIVFYFTTKSKLLKNYNLHSLFWSKEVWIRLIEYP